MVKPLKWFSILLTRAKYLSRVGSRAKHSFSIWLATTFESVRSVHVWTPMALNLLSPQQYGFVFSYVVGAFVCLLVNCNLAA
jgi:hypothetical protein